MAKEYQSCELWPLGGPRQTVRKCSTEKREKFSTVAHIPIHVASAKNKKRNQQIEREDTIEKGKANAFLPNEFG